MVNFAEVRAAEFRAALGVRGVGGPQSVNRLLQWTGGLFTVERADRGEGRCERRDDGGWRIIVPLRAKEGWETANCLAHEVGHGLTWREGRSEQKAEEEAEEFRLSFILPRNLVRAACRDSSDAVAELAYSAGMPPAMICDRLDWNLTHAPPDLSAPAPWSAWGRYRASIRYNLHHRGVVVEGERVAFAWLCPSDAEFLTLRHDLAHHLRSETPEEFRLVHEPHRLRVSTLPFGER